ncbi:MAG TPA: metalloregulator ArsR/SmtB family transcription factor [Acidimicrobiia bacterium]|nr:metalloregulator ArsR/SmtB family transcription factor [Acidimicrobiia bacterium]
MREADPFAALGDPNRRAIVRSLADGEKSVQEIANEMTISRPAVSRHLRVLKSAGLVEVRPDGVRNLYSLDSAGVDDVRAFMEETWGTAVARFRLFVDNTD